MRDDEICHLPCFFKLIFSPRLDFQKLEIPRKFLEKYGEELSDEIKLEVPNGGIWKVDLVREQSRAWLHKGWSEFVKFYSIYNGHFLLFKYKNRSNFYVIIFDMSAAEIAYPAIAAHLTPCRLAIKTETGSSADPIPLVDSNPENEDMETVLEAKANRIIGRRCDLTRDEAKRVEAHSCEQPSFVIKVKASYVNMKFNVSIPEEFVKKYLKEKRGRFTLQNEVGKTWSVWCINESKGHGIYVAFKNGWKSFALDNKLQVDDICIFELINYKNKLFKVKIVRVARKNPQLKSKVD